ncbi:MAG: hypothetical protein HYR55_01030 [Acidobacteria bacterium]|nr:hypothetical protein [Acidobacteriota bacterium]
MTENPQGLSHEKRDSVLLAVFLFSLIFITIWLFTRQFWWFPSQASAHAADMDKTFIITFTITGILFVLLQAILGYLIFRYRDKGDHPPAYKVNRRLEFRFALVAGVIILGVDIGLALKGEGSWFKLFSSPPADAMIVEVTAEQFAWNFRYAGKDGLFGRTDPKLITNANQIGLDKKDPAAKDDVLLINQMHLPVDRPVRVRLLAKDVIHSFFLPHQRIKQDAVPGMMIEISFTPTKTGQFEIACNQLCGLGHYRMRAFLTVEPQESFDRWLSEQSP